MNTLSLSFKVFVIGLVTFGGGQVFLPLFKSLLVDDFKFLNAEGFSTLIALSNAFPGPLVIKLAGYSGYLASGYFGMTMALLAACVPALIIMIFSCSHLNKIKNMQVIKDINVFMKPLIIGIFLSFVCDFSKTSFSSLGLVHSIILMFGSFMLSFIKIKGKSLGLFYIIIGAVVYSFLFIK